MATVVDQLRNTEKGRLKYFTNWSPKDVLMEMQDSLPQIRQPNDAIFEIKSIKAMLEAIEDDTQVFMKNLMEDEAVESRRIEESQIKDTDDDSEFDNYHPLGYDITLQDCEYSSQEEKRRDDHELIRQCEEFFEEIARKTHEAALQRRQREIKQRQEREEMEQRFYEELKESSAMIRKQMQKHEADIIRTRQQQEEERKLRLQLLERQRRKETLDKFSKITQEIQTIYKDILSLIQNCDFKSSPEFLQSRISSLLENCGQIFLRTKTTPDNLGDQHVIQAENDLHILKINSKNFLDEISLVNEKVKNRKLVELKQQELILKQKKITEAEQKAQSSKQPEIPPIPKSTEKPSGELHKKLKMKMAEYEDAGNKLTKSGNPELKKLVMHLSRAVSLPIGSITGRSGSDVKRVACILTNVVKSNQVTVGNKTLSTKGNSIAIKFAENLIAKKLVSQANTQVSSNFSSAFSIALIVIAVWAESPDFGDLFLAHLQAKCIYSVPMYHKLLSSGVNADDQLKAMGYEVSDDGQVEGQDKFLRRMSGLIRLYAAIIQSPLPPGVSNHPHGLEEGWRYLAELLNMEPITDVTTTVLYDFLEVAGHSLMKTYKSQFSKMLSAICRDFYPKLEAVADDKASLMRLKLFLEKCVKENRVPVPDGRLDKSFWNTYHSGQVVGE